MLAWLDECLANALDQLATEAKDWALFNARHLTNDLADIVQCSLLLQEAQHELATTGTAHKALVAAWHSRKTFEHRGQWDPRQRGIVEEMFTALVSVTPRSPKSRRAACDRPGVAPPYGWTQDLTWPNEVLD